MRHGPLERKKEQPNNTKLTICRFVIVLHNDIYIYSFKGRYMSTCPKRPNPIDIKHPHGHHMMSMSGPGRVQ